MKALTSRSPPVVFGLIAIATYVEKKQHNLGFATLAIPITTVTGDLSKNQVTGFDYSGPWYPGAGGEGIVDTGAMGSFKFDPKTGILTSVTIKSTYKESYKRSKYTSIFTSVNVPEPSSWLLLLVGLATCWKRGPLQFFLATCRK
jgi:hypothetical protein